MLHCIRCRSGHYPPESYVPQFVEPCGVSTHRDVRRGPGGGGKNCNLVECIVITGVGAAIAVAVDMAIEDSPMLPHVVFRVLAATPTWPAKAVVNTQDPARDERPWKAHNTQRERERETCMAYYAVLFP